MIPIALILHNIRSTYNVGSILRTADCFGIQNIYFSGYTPYPSHSNDSRMPHIAKRLTSQIAKTALGAEQTVTFSVYDTIEAAISAARRDGYHIAALEQDEQSVLINKYTFLTATAFVLGNELSGIDEWTKHSADVILEIKQYGTKESLNVANATAIAVYAARSQQQN
jgi:23S rRNA (guanosine2251-2'-O)-methyltransferase